MSEVNPKDLKVAIKALNATGALESKINIVGTKTEVLLDLFTEAVEAMHKEEMEIPDEVIVVYNTIYADAEDEKKEEEEELKKKPAAKKKAVPKKKAEVPKKKVLEKKAPEKKETKKKTSSAAKDDFGYTIGSKPNKFCMAIKKKAMTMAEVKELDWNEKNTTFYTVFKLLVEKGLAEKNEKTDKMKIKK